MQNNLLKKPRSAVFKEDHYPILTAQSKRYQYFLILFIVCIWVLSSFIGMISAFVFMNPLFSCQGQKTTEVLACKKIESCVIVNSFTAVSRNHLYCEREWLRQLIQTAVFIGNSLGVFLLPLLSDFIGRRKSYILGIFSGFIGSLILLVGIYTNNSALMISGNICCGIYSSGMVSMTYIIVTEFFDNHLRQKALIYCNGGWPIASMTFILIDEYLPEWYNYVVFLLVIPLGAIFLISLFFLTESPVYLLIKKPNMQKYRQVLFQISLYNSADFTDIELDILDMEKENFQDRNEPINQTNFKDALTIIIKNKRNLFILICLALSKFGYGIFYTGVQNSMERFGFSFGVSMFFVGIHEFFAFLTASFVVPRCPRKKGLLVVVFLSSALGLCFLFGFVKDSRVLQTLLASVTRITCSYSVSFQLMLLTESFEPRITSQAITISAGSGQVAKLLIPYLVTHMNDLNIEPIIACSVLFFIFGFIPINFVKQTFKKSL